MDIIDLEKDCKDDDNEDVIIIDSDIEDTTTTTHNVKRTVKLIKYSKNIEKLSITRTGQIRKRNVECVINIKESEIIDICERKCRKKKQKQVNKEKNLNTFKDKSDEENTFRNLKIERTVPKCGRRPCRAKFYKDKSSRTEVNIKIKIC